MNHTGSKALKILLSCSKGNWVRQSFFIIFLHLTLQSVWKGNQFWKDFPIVEQYLNWQNSNLWWPYFFLRVDNLRNKLAAQTYFVHPVISVCPPTHTPDPVLLVDYSVAIHPSLPHLLTIYTSACSQSSWRPLRSLVSCYLSH